MTTIRSRYLSSIGLSQLFIGLLLLLQGLLAPGPADQSGGSGETNGQSEARGGGLLEVPSLPAIIVGRWLQMRQPLLCGQLLLCAAFPLFSAGLHRLN